MKRGKHEGAMIARRLRDTQRAVHVSGDQSLLDDLGFTPWPGRHRR